MALRDYCAHAVRCDAARCGLLPMQGVVSCARGSVMPCVTVRFVGEPSSICNYLGRGESASKGNRMIFIIIWFNETVKNVVVLHCCHFSTFFSHQNINTPMQMIVLAV